jgi:hypothetical protein
MVAIGADPILSHIMKPWLFPDFPPFHPTVAGVA